MRSVRCAVVGLDSAFWPAAFRQVILEHPDAELVAMCGADIAPEVIERDFVVPVDAWLAERGETRIPTIDGLLELDFDAAFVCSRNSTMPTIAERLIRAGKHVFVAKPMAITSIEAQRYLAGNEAGVIVTAGQLASTWQPWPTMRALADDGRIGRILSMRAIHQHGNYRDFPPALWYADPTEGDAFNWLGWYPVEVIRAVMGPVAQVSGIGRQAASSHGDMPDQLAGIFEMADGRHATADVYFTVGSWGMAMQEGELIGERGIIRFRGPGSEIQVLDDNGEQSVSFEPRDGLLAEVDAFFGAILSRGRPAIEVADAVHVASVCAAWRQAATSGRAVKVG